MELDKLKNINLENLPKPIIIAGPCSAESEQQMLETAKGLKKIDIEVPIFRAGIWKPRTKPNGFEGVGIIGLQWLKKVKEEFGFQTAVEVATAQHVEAAQKAEVDIFWIGARSTANPFTVQEIAESLRGSDKTVLVKNPVNPDLDLWIGGLERLLAKDIKNLGAIHRGFSTYRKTKYRNAPNWQIALDFKNKLPNIPLLIDPSHICGNRSGLASVAQEALNLGYHGIMIETHPDPDNAWSDAKQQITPEALGEILKNLIIRNQSSPDFDEAMNIQRTMMSDIDQQLIELLSQRMKISEQIGTVKKEKNLTVFQPERWKEVAEYANQKADEIGVNKDFVERLFKVIHEESVELQNRLMNGEQ